MHLTTLLLLLPFLLTTALETDYGPQNRYEEEPHRGYLDDGADFRTVTKPAGADQLNWCDRRPYIAGGGPGIERCHNITDATGKGSMPCHNLGMDNAPMMGMWPSKDINCQVFVDDWCRTMVFDKAKGVQVKLESARLLSGDNKWGVDDFGSSLWREKGFQGEKRGKGPKSVWCWRVDKKQVGLGGGKRRKREETRGEEEEEEEEEEEG